MMIEKIIKKVELKKCPFCGGEAYFERFYDRCERKDKVYVECGTCEIKTPELAYSCMPDGESTIDGEDVDCIRYVTEYWNKPLRFAGEKEDRIARKEAEI